MQARSLLVRGLALLIAVALFVLTGEAALRVFYRDAGRRTLGGPGPRTFDHLTIGRDQLRGRRDVGPRREGVPRLMAVGDSITYGLGVHDWRETWPEVLATRLEREGHAYELAVFAEPGRDIKDHLQQLERWGSVVNPDVLIYQWYVNDIEVMSPFRPDRTRRWQQWAGHEWLRRTSYLYFFLDQRAGALLPSPGRSYVNFILQDLRAGTPEWAEFERYFHAFAVRAATIAKRRILLLYPQVPFKDRYPLQPLTDLMRTAAGPHTLAIPLAAWIRSGGAIENDTAAPFAVALRVPAGPSAMLLETQEYVHAPGLVRAHVVAGAPALPKGPATIGTLQLIDPVSGEIVSSGTIALEGGASGYQTVNVPLDVPGTDLRRLRFRLTTAGTPEWRLASLGLAVDYGFDVLDLAEPLNRFNTHASLFDAHPNEAAHRVIADEVHRVLLSGRAE